MLLLAGCSTASTFVEPAQTTLRFNQVDIVAGTPNVEVPDEVTHKFEGMLADGLYRKGAFASGPDLRLVYAFLSHDVGNRFERFFLLTNGGEGVVTLQVRYLDRDERELARTEVEGRAAGLFGGSMDSALRQAANDIVEYTVKHFLSTPLNPDANQGR